MLAWCHFYEITERSPYTTFGKSISADVKVSAPHIRSIRLDRILLAPQVLVLSLFSFGLIQSLSDIALGTALLVQMLWPYFILPACIILALVLMSYAIAFRPSLQIKLSALKLFLLLVSYFIASYVDLGVSWKLLLAIITAVILIDCYLFSVQTHKTDGV